VNITQQELPFEQWTRSGSTSVEFFLAANPGERPKPLAKIASGGELSRIMLGLKSVAPLAHLVETLVFDEIDAGIGGGTAARVAHQLKSLAAGRQVIVITHLHQIAAQADSHCEVNKVTRDGRHVPVVRAVNASERKAALARLIAGDDSGPGVERADRAQRLGRSD
jgi:DNA repair protein RecN (Recombination protein N)